MRRCFSLLLLAALVLLALPASAFAKFGISTFTIVARNADATIDESAASHPFDLDVHLAMNVDALGEPEGVLHEIRMNLPPGLFGNPLRIPRCARLDFEGTITGCEGSTQVGVLQGLVRGLGQIQIPIYNLATTSGSPAAFGGSVDGKLFVQRLDLGGSGATTSIRLSGTLPAEPAMVDIEEEIWGIPADSAHDPKRICHNAKGEPHGGCSADAEEQALLTLPASCTEPLRTTLTATSLGPPVETAVAGDVSRDAAGNPRPLVGCDAVPFDPSLTFQTEDASLAPTSLKVGVGLPQHEAVHVAPTAPLGGLQMELPEGLALNPAAGSWIASCSPADVGLESAPGIEPSTFNEYQVACPASSRLGSAKLQTPLVGHELSGVIYLATPSANPFAALFAIYLVIEDEDSGTILKIPGRLEADSTSGRLSAFFPELPQLAFSNLELEFVGGQRAPLVSPSKCGRYSSEATFTPSTAPLGFPVTRTSTFTISAGAGGGSCPPPESARNAAPLFRAGTEDPLAGSDSSLVIGFSRKDLDQHFGSFDLTLPPGLIANLGSTPVGSAIGSVQIQAGVGSQPLTLNGTAYLGGPYRGSPYSLEFVVQARAGPFDFGTIVERAAVDVDPGRAQISVHAAPLSRILSGVPLELRSLTVDLDRPGFVRNPTSCEPMAISGSATSSLGQVTPLSARFQASNCALLRFRPKLSLSLSGISRRGAHPGIHVTLRPRPGDANLSGATVTLPPSELLDNRRVKAVCPADRFALGECPKGALVGRATVSTPALRRPLEGNVYLLGSAGRLPMLATSLEGEVHTTFVAKVDSVHRRLRFHLVGIPDVPLEKVTLDLFGGTRGVIVDNGGVCSGTPRVKAFFTAQNGRTDTVRPLVRSRCASARRRGH